MGAATIMAIAAVAGAAMQNRNARNATRAAGQAAQDGAAAADPAAAHRPFFQNELLARWPQLSGTNFGEILSDPSFQFLKQQGETAAVNHASAAGLLRSGTLLEDLSKFNQDLSSTYIDKQFARQMGMLGILGNFSGLNIGNPGAAGNILAQGGLSAAQLGYNANANTQQGIGNAINQVGRLFSQGGSGYSGGYGSNFGGPINTDNG